MRHLEKLTCEEIKEELAEAYRDIQVNAHLYRNTTFEFIADPAHEFNEIKQEFNAYLA